MLAQLDHINRACQVIWIKCTSNIPLLGYLGEAVSTADGCLKHQAGRTSFLLHRHSLVDGLAVLQVGRHRGIQAKEQVQQQEERNTANGGSQHPEGMKTDRLTMSDNAMFPLKCCHLFLNTCLTLLHSCVLSLASCVYIYTYPVWGGWCTVLQSKVTNLECNLLFSSDRFTVPCFFLEIRPSVALQVMVLTAHSLAESHSLNTSQSPA